VEKERRVYADNKPVHDIMVKVGNNRRVRVKNSPWPPSEPATPPPRVCAANDSLRPRADIIRLADARRLGCRVKPGNGEEGVRRLYLIRKCFSLWPSHEGKRSRPASEA